MFLVTWSGLLDEVYDVSQFDFFFSWSLWYTKDWKLFSEFVSVFDVFVSSSPLLFVLCFFLEWISPCFWLPFSGLSDVNIYYFFFVWVCSVVLDFRACQYFGFLGLGYFSAVLILPLLLLTVLTPDFGLYLKDVKFSNLCCCKSFFGFSFIECYNVLCLFVIIFFKLLFWHRFGLISCCFGFFILSCHNMPPSISLTRYICYVA